MTTFTHIAPILFFGAKKKVKNLSFPGKPIKTLLKIQKY